MPPQDKRPYFSQLSHADKDQFIDTLLAHTEVLEAKLGINSQIPANRRHPMVP